MTPEKNFNQDVWYVLQEIRKKSLYAADNKFVSYEISSSVVAVGYPLEQEEIAILGKLRQWQAIKIINKKGILDDYGLESGIAYFLEILQPKFDEIYKKYQDACDLQSYLNTIALGENDGNKKFLEVTQSIEERRKNAIELFRSYYDGKNEAIKISSSVLEENGFGEDFWERICPQLQREGVLKEYSKFLFPIEYVNQPRADAIWKDLIRLSSMRIEEKEMEGIFNPLFVHDKYSWRVLNEFDELKKNEPKIEEELKSIPTLYTFIIDGKKLKNVQNNKQKPEIKKVIGNEFLQQAKEPLHIVIDDVKKDIGIRGFEGKVVLQKPKNKRIQLRKFPADLKWKEISIQFLNEHEVIIKAKNETLQTTYEAMGFQDEKKKLPNKQWQFLRLLAVKKGEVSWDNNYNLSLKQINSIKKQKQLLSEALKAYFQIHEDEPFHDYKIEKAYRIKLIIIPEPELKNINEREVYDK